MAITQTGAIYKAFSFDNVSSRDYGVYITSDAVYNAPERDVEMISIPGRNGAFALDRGRFENIEVTYPAGIFADNETDFAQAVSDLRNYLCSKKGYFRLSDEYNPDEYRMAVYKSGLEVSPAQLKAGEFEIIFECKPQRWLTSGEVEITVDDGDTITNPTRFDASPLLQIDGKGTISFNGYAIEIGEVIVGNIRLPYTKSGNTYTIGDLDKLNSYDSITVHGLKYTEQRKYNVRLVGQNYSNAYCTGWSGCTVSGNVLDYVNMHSTTTFPDFEIIYGTAWSKTVTSQATSHTSEGSGYPNTFTVAYSITVSYDGDDTITITTTNADSSGAPAPTSTTYSHSVSKITAFSTVVYEFDSIYCDCDFGEFYRIDDGEIISMNYLGDLGSDLPKLASGANEITYDSTITGLKITPRWWKV